MNPLLDFVISVTFRRYIYTNMPFKPDIRACYILPDVIAEIDCRRIAADGISNAPPRKGTAMLKEYFIKHYGVPSFMLNSGSLGSAYSSLQIADAFPGLFDGVLISAVFPDALSIGLSGMDVHLLTHYFARTDPVDFTDGQKLAVSGYAGQQAFLDAANQAGRTDPVSNRRDVAAYVSGQWGVVRAYPDKQVVPASLRYDPVSNPAGARPTIFDVSATIYGRDPRTGLAQRPFDNQGIQCGLGALDAGAITPEQFLDLNEKIGGYDQDGITRRAAAAPTPMRCDAPIGAG